MKLTTDYDRNQQGFFRRRHRQAQELRDKVCHMLLQPIPNQFSPQKCPCEALADRILQGDSPAQLHRWALHLQPPNYLKQLIVSLSPTLTQPAAMSGQQFSHSANLQQWQNSAGGVAVAPGQFGQYSFDSLERSKRPKQLGQGDCEQHRALFLAILANEKGGGFFALLNR